MVATAVVTKKVVTKNIAEGGSKNMGPPAETLVQCNQSGHRLNSRHHSLSHQSLSSQSLSSRQNHSQNHSRTRARTIIARSIVSAVTTVVVTLWIVAIRVADFIANIALRTIHWIARAARA